MVTIFKNIFDKQPFYVSIETALKRIQAGSSRELISEIRKQLSKERADKLKVNLPSVCFSGKFEERKDEKLLEHSGFLILDFDEVFELREKQTEIISNDFVYACWVSPRGNGLKALVKIADGKKHREHFEALKEIFPEVDKSGINESRVCYESYDPELYLNENVKPFRKVKKTERVQQTQVVSENSVVFQNILKWLTNRGDAFVTGERNIFIFKLASACCRFGLSEQESISLIDGTVIVNETSFSKTESDRAIKSAYRANKSKYGTARFEKDIVVDKVTRKEIQIDEQIFDESIRPKDVIFGEDVKERALKIYESGYERLDGIGVNVFDEHFKLKRGEISLLTGIGNYGKTTFWHWFLLMRILKFDEKFAFFSPENNPPEEFYHDFVEVVLGADCTPYNRNRPSKNIYEAAYDFVSKRIFYVYPKDIAPSPAYVKERFLELIIKEKVSGVLIDPFNQLANDYKSEGGRTDKYLETFLSDCSRFAQMNNIFFNIIAHPKAMRKDGQKSYPCPDVFDIADGAMWNNKMDNILVYHRPNHQEDPTSTLCELHTKKIRRQKTVGRKGVVEFELFRAGRRYFFDGSDVMQKLLNEKGLDFGPKQNTMFTESWKPLEVKNFYETEKDELF